MHVARRGKGLANVHNITAVKVLKDDGAGAGVGVSGTGEDSFQAPDMNVVGASETSQIGQALGMAQSNLTVDLYWSDVEKMNNQNRV